MAEVLRVGTVLRWLEELAPFELAEEWDNVGLLVGSPAQEVSGIAVALDVEEWVLERAASAGANLLVTHHPLIFRPLPALRTDLPVGRLAAQALRLRMAVVAAHTNLDVAVGGVNDALAQVLGLQSLVPLAPVLRGRRARPPLGPEKGSELEEGPGLGRLGELPEECTLRELACRIKERLRAARVFWAGDPERPVRQLAVCGGRGGGLIAQAVARGADAFLTGDLDYHQWQEARRLGLAVLDAGHAPTEAVVLPPLAAYLRARVDEAAGEAGRRGRVEVLPPEESPSGIEAV